MYIDREEGCVIGKLIPALLCNCFLPRPSPPQGLHLCPRLAAPLHPLEVLVLLGRRIWTWASAFTPAVYIQSRTGPLRTALSSIIPGF